MLLTSPWTICKLCTIISPIKRPLKRIMHLPCFKSIIMTTLVHNNLALIMKKRCFQTLESLNMRSTNTNCILTWQIQVTRALTIDSPLLSSNRTFHRCIHSLYLQYMTRKWNNNSNGHISNYLLHLTEKTFTTWNRTVISTHLNTTDSYLWEKCPNLAIKTTTVLQALNSLLMLMVVIYSLQLLKLSLIRTPYQRLTYRWLLIYFKVNKYRTTNNNLTYPLIS